MNVQHAQYFSIFLQLTQLTNKILKKHVVVLENSTIKNLCLQFRPTFISLLKTLLIRNQPLLFALDFLLHVQTLQLLAREAEHVKKGEGVLSTKRWLTLCKVLHMVRLSCGGSPI
jgi:hypothetical protein